MIVDIYCRYHDSYCPRCRPARRGAIQIYFIPSLGEIYTQVTTARRQIWASDYASDRTRNVQFGAARLGRPGDQIADHNGGSRALAADQARSLGQPHAKLFRVIQQAADYSRNSRGQSPLIS